MGETTRPCPICGHELAPRRIPLRDWLLHPIASLGARRYDQTYPFMHFMINHAETTTVHELSPNAYGNWSSRA